MRLLLAIARTGLGYCVAVLLATVFTISVYILIGPQENGVTSDMATVVFGGLVYTFVFGLPGFLVFLVTIWRFPVRGFLTPTLAGAANAWLAMWLLMTMAGATPVSGDSQNPLLLGMPQYIMLSASAGGASGGWAWYLFDKLFRHDKAEL